MNTVKSFMKLMVIAMAFSTVACGNDESSSAAAESYYLSSGNCYRSSDRVLVDYSNCTSSSSTSACYGWHMRSSYYGMYSIYCDGVAGGNCSGYNLYRQSDGVYVTCQ